MLFLNLFKLQSSVHFTAADTMHMQTKIPFGSFEVELHIPKMQFVSFSRKFFTKEIKTICSMGIIRLHLFEVVSKVFVNWIYIFNQAGCYFSVFQLKTLPVELCWLRWRSLIYWRQLQKLGHSWLAIQLPEVHAWGQNNFFTFLFFFFYFKSVVFHGYSITQRNKVEYKVGTLLQFVCPLTFPNNSYSTPLAFASSRNLRHFLSKVINTISICAAVAYVTLSALPNKEAPIRDHTKQKQDESTKTITR